MRRATNLDVEWIGAGDGEPERPDARPRRGRGTIAVVVAAVLAALYAVAIVADRPAPADGAQLASPAVETTSAEFRAWRVLTPLDGSQREGWPRPMLADGTELCFGFENEAIGPPRRPSLARCVDRTDLAPLLDAQLVSLITIRSGLDVWHVLMTADPPTAVELRTVEGETVGADRIHVDGRIVALRLAIDAPIAELTWAVGRSEVRCDPPGDVNADARFCPSPPGS